MVSIEAIRAAVMATPPKHCDRARRLGILSSLLSARHQRTGDMGDLQAAIRWVEEAVKITPEGHIDRGGFFNNLGIYLESRYLRRGVLGDLEEAIRVVKEAISISPPDSPNRVGRLNNLGNKLSTKYKQTKDPNDLQGAIIAIREAVAGLPPDHPEEARYLSNLSSNLRTSFEDTGAIEDLQMAIELAEKAVASTPLDHPDLAIYLKNLGMGLRRRYERTGDLIDRGRAVKSMKKAVALKFAPPSTRVNVAQHLGAMLEEDEDWVGASEAMGEAVDLLPLCSSRSLQQQDQQDIIAIYFGLASRAAAMTLQAGGSAFDAVRFLELGRGVITNLQLETRTDLTDLRLQYPALANRFEELRDELNSPTDTSLESLEFLPSRRHTTGEQLDETIADIRQLPGFETFLLPLTASDLMSAVTAPSHSVVFLNVSFRCDAFIIQTDTIRTVQLPCLNLPDISKKAISLIEGTLRNYDMLGMLEWLWKNVTSPVLEELELTDPVTDGNWSRVWWIPTGPLCLFPIHASGCYFENTGHTVLDRVISSYSPSVKALLYSLREKNKEGRVQVPHKAVLISMENTPKYPKLPYAKLEVAELDSLLPDSIQKVTLDEPHKTEVLDALEGCTIFHFAGHGESHPSDPSKSSLLVADGPETRLTVGDMIATTKLYENPPFLAYLSACSTGNNQVSKLLDEGIHLMGAFQLAGFQHVIGSLWEVSDAKSADVAKYVYKCLLDANMSYDSVSHGLHMAIRTLRDSTNSTGRTRNARLIDDDEELPESSITDPLLWAPYVHMGI